MRFFTHADRQNFKVIMVNPEDGVVVVQGAVPGPVGGLVTIRPAIKKTAAAAA